MSSPYVYDGINIFKYSPTGQGTRRVGGDAAYQQRYARVIALAVDKMWLLWRQNEIGAEILERNRGGESGVREGFDIRINQMFQPDNEPRAYSNTQNQSKLAAFSLILAHEAIHLVHNLNLVEEEVICRTVELLYFQDLLHGLSYTSRVTGERCNARLSAGSSAGRTVIRDCNDMRRWHERAQLVDYVLRIPTYQHRLSAQFVRRSFRWWGGIGNRQPLTKGLYLRALAEDGQRADVRLMIEILQSFSSQAEWQEAGVAPADYAMLRQALIGPNSPSSPIAVEVESALRRSNNPTFARIMRQIGVPADRYPL
jgi:hypothetical protein